MKCSSCGNELPINAQFCDNCGQKIEISSDDNLKTYCGNCGADIETNTDFCGNCGFPIQSAVQAKESHIFCGNCGAELENGIQFCGECGCAVGNIPSDEAMSGKPVKKKKRAGIIITVITLAIILFAAIGVTAYIYHTQYDKIHEQTDEELKDTVETSASKPAQEENTPNTQSINESISAVREQPKETQAILPPVFKMAMASSVRSSQQDSTGKLNDYSPSNVLDHDPTTCWAMDLSTGITPEITLRADEKQHVSGIKFSDGYFKSNEIYMKNRRITEVKILYEGGYCEYNCAESGGFRIMQDVLFDAPADTAYITIQVTDSVSGTYNDICISEIEVY